MSMENSQIARIERRSSLTSAVITLLILALLYIGIYFLRDMGSATRGQNGTSREYEVVGALDFGDMQEGSGDNNSFLATQENAQAAQEAAAANRNLDDAKSANLTQTQPSPVSAPAKEDKAEQQASPTPSKTANSNTNGVNTQSQPSQNNYGRDLAGANHGNAQNSVGNAGSSSVKKLDPNGQYTFAEDGGANGLQGRAPIELPYPSYTIQEEGKVTFEFQIKPDGSVEYVKVVGLTNKPGLKNAGMDAIRKWRFSPIPANKPQVVQTVQVTINFKLRG